MTDDRLARQEALKILDEGSPSPEEEHRLINDPAFAEEYVREARRKVEARRRILLTEDVNFYLQTAANIATVAAVLVQIAAWVRDERRKKQCQFPMPPSNGPCGGQFQWGVDAEGFMYCVHGHKTQTPFREE